MITCPKCGELNGENKTTCFSCGTKLDEETRRSYEKKFDNTKKQMDIEIESLLQEINSARDFIVTKTDNIEGKKITKYFGTVSGTHIYLVGGLLGGGFASQEKLFGAAYNTAENLMIKKAIDKGADAIVSIQTSIVSPGGVNDIIVIVQGTAVKTEDV